MLINTPKCQNKKRKKIHRRNKKEYNFTHHGYDVREQELAKEDSKRNNKRFATHNNWGCSSYAMPR